MGVVRVPDRTGGIVIPPETEVNPVFDDEGHGLSFFLDFGTREIGYPAVQPSEYAGIYVADNATPTTISNPDEWTLIDVFDTNGPSRGASPDHTQNHIVIGSSGDYFIVASISFSGAVGGQVFEIEVQTNNGARRLPHFHAERKVGAGGDVGSASISGVAPMVEGETVEVWVKNTSGTGDITAKDVSLALVSASE